MHEKINRNKQTIDMERTLAEKKKLESFVVIDDTNCMCCLLLDYLFKQLWQETTKAFSLKIKVLF